MATLTFKCKPKDDKLEVTIVSCEGLPDLDGALNLTDPYVVVRVGKEKQKTKAVGGALNPEFNQETSTFLFENGPEVALQSRIRFHVMDKDTFTPDDLIGKASIKLSEVDQTGEPITLELVSLSDGETYLSDGQTTAIYRLFSVLDPANTGKIDPELKNLVAENTSKASVLLGELNAYMEDKDESGDVSFGEFLEQFRLHEDPGDAEDIDKLTEEFKELLKAKADKPARLVM